MMNGAETELAFGGASGIIVLVAYGAIMLAVGLITWLRNRGLHESTDEYYLGGRGLGVMVLFFTFFATQYSGNTVVGYPPEAYRTGYAYLVSVPFFIVIMLIYSWLGGMRSVAYTDTMQGIALLIGVVMLLIGALLYLGSPAESAVVMQARAPENLAPPSGPGLLHWFSLLVLVGIGAAVYPHAVQRIFSAKSEATLKRSLTRMAYMPFATAGVVFVVGIIGVAAFPGMDTADSEQLVGRMASAIASENIVFYWAMVLLFGGVIAAIVSTADSVLLTFSSIISHDLYGRFVNAQAPDSRRILVGKLFGVAAVIVLIMIAWHPPSTLYRIFILKFELLVQVAPALILGLYWNRLDARAVFAGMLVGALLASALTLAGLQPLGLFNGLWGLIANLAIVGVGSLVFGADTRQREIAARLTAI